VKRYRVVARMSGSTDEDDEITRQYNEWLDEENDQGPIFGHRTMYYDRGRNMCAAERSSCETCQDGRMQCSVHGSITIIAPAHHVEP
jgi:endonuclease III